MRISEQVRWALVLLMLGAISGALVASCTMLAALKIGVL